MSEPVAPQTQSLTEEERRARRRAKLLSSGADRLRVLSGTGSGLGGGGWGG
jgi:hypothetical protein